MTTKVYLVGAGPGDPGLLTMAGAAALRQADLVVYDFLANVRLLELAPESARRIYVGKSSGQHTLSQDQINELLVREAQALKARGGGTIVRLKGGDPFVFGRGGEEAEVLRHAGIEFIIVPGVTAGIAGPAYAGIPVTHRNWTSTLTIITGHEKEESDGPRVDYEALAKLGGTLVFYMGVKNLPLIASRLLQAGLASQTPCAVIRWATHPHQQTVSGPLEQIASIVEKAGITAPAITLIGQVAGLRESLNWFESRPLFGQRILVTRTRQQASQLSQGLLDLGAEVLEAPTIDLIEPTDLQPIDETLKALAQRGAAAWDALVFTSANGVMAVWKRLRACGLDARALAGPRLAAIGPATAEALLKIGLVADLIPETFVGEALARALEENFTQGGTWPLAGKKFLLLRADIARPVLREELTRAGAQVSDLAVYQTALPKTLPESTLSALKEGRLDWITFTSASTARNLHTLLPEELRVKVAGIRKLSIGPITTQAMRELGWEPTLEATQHDIPGMISCLEEWRK